MLKRVTTTCMVMSLLSASASAYSILWAATSDHTDLVKDEEYEAAPVELFMALVLEDDASALVECVDGLEILYEEPTTPEPISIEEAVPPELTGVEDEVQMDFISVEEEPAPELLSVEEEPEEPEAELEEIELEEPLYDDIQEP